MFNLFRKKNKNSNSIITELTELITTVKSFITKDSDMTYCYFETPEELIQALDHCIEELKNGKILEVIDELEIEFLPTGSLQEHSLSNGWSKEYLLIASQFDSIQQRIKTRNE